MTGNQARPHGNTEALALIGERLRSRRQELGLSLAEVEAETKIRVHYLEALEYGQPEMLPGPVYAIGFVRSYAALLGYDGPAIAAEYQSALNPRPPRRERPAAAPKDAAPGAGAAPPSQARGQGKAPPLINEAPLRAKPAGRSASARGRHSPWRTPLILLLLLSLAVGGYIVYAALRAAEAPPDDGVALDPPSPRPPDPPVDPDPHPDPPPPVVPPFGPELITSAVGPAGELVITVDWPELQVEMIFADRVWVRALADGQVVADGTQDPQSVLAIGAQNRIEVRVGRAVRTRVVILGVDTGTVGTADDPRTVIIRRAQ